MGTEIIPDDEVTIEEQTIPDEDVQVSESEVSLDSTMNKTKQGMAQAALSNFINVTPMERAIAFGVGGIPPVMAGVKEAEDALPFVMGTIGGTLGAMLGHPHLGVGTGTAIGELEKQSLEKLKGETEDIKVIDALIIGGLASTGSKGVDIALKSVGLGMNLINERARAKLFEKALQAVEIGNKILKRNWSRSVNRLAEQFPETRINLREPIQRLREMIDQTGDDNLVPQLKTAVSRSPRLSDMVNNPDNAIGATLQEAIELKNAITSTTNEITRKAIKGKTTPNERLVFEVLDLFDDAITSNFQQMSEIRRIYSAGKKAYEMARPLVERGRSVEASIFSEPKGIFGVGGTPFMGSTQGKLAFQDIASLTTAGEKMFKTAELAHNLNRAADFVGRMGQIAFGGSVARWLTSGEEKV